MEPCKHHIFVHNHSVWLFIVYNCNHIAFWQPETMPTAEISNHNLKALGRAKEMGYRVDRAEIDLISMLIYVLRP
eukprot:UN01533